MTYDDALTHALESAFSFLSSHIYVTLFTLVAVHFGITYLLNTQPNSLPKSKSDPLRISEIYIYPIKSLRGTRVSKALATRNGFAYDRTFMLLQVTDDGGLKNMLVADYPQMTQFLTSMVLPETAEQRNGSLTVEFIAKGTNSNNTITFSLQPDTANLEPMDINMHGSATKAFQMPTEYNAWFSACFGFEVVLAYIGDNRRDVLFQDLKSAKPSPYLSGFMSEAKSKGQQITFSDCAQYLVVSKTSLADVSSRLPEGEDMDITKFRPNIVLEGAAEPWEEDYWGKLIINGTELTCAHNCVRCKSINVDYATGQTGTGESGQVLKKLQKDRRIDKGSKWSPVFGRYSYWSSKNKDCEVKEGDNVFVTQVNKERTVWTWPGLG